MVISKIHGRKLNASHVINLYMVCTSQKVLKNQEKKTILIDNMCKIQIVKNIPGPLGVDGCVGGNWQPSR